ncbi:MAG TPA: HDOD domain-containing protein [Burkholderiaceae bacterium]|nr:HDOD domain-containing protein [Burkholderiaceae bacterium]
MTQSVLDNLTLGYQPLWNQLRQLTGVQLFVGSGSSSPVDATHLLSVLQEAWPEQAPPLLLSIQTHQLLGDVIALADQHSPWVEVREDTLSDPAMAQRVHGAHQRGLKMIWRGEPGERPNSTLASCFARNMVTLTAEEALSGLRASLIKHNGTAALSATPSKSPVVPGHVYEAVASRALVEHCLDDQGAWAVAGWPSEDVLHGYRHRLIQPDHRAVVKLIEATMADDSMESIEHTLAEEPVLVYRFLRYVNSAALGLPSAIDSLRHGLMVLGYSKLKAWLLEQLPHTSSDLNLRPIRVAMVMRARLMEHLLDAGAEDALRRDVYLCGLLSQIDLFLGEPLGTALQRLPLSPRIGAAILAESGPYLPYLQVATALESPQLRHVGILCKAHQISSEEVNRALLRTLSIVQTNPARGHLFA